MNSRYRQLTLGLLLTISLAGLAPAQDQVQPLRGTPLRGLVSEEQTSPTQIVVEVSGAPRQIAVNEVQRVTFTEDPPELQRGRASILSGQVEAGYDELRKVNLGVIKRPLVRADVQYYLAYAQGKLAVTGGGDKGAAAKAMLAFVSANPKSFHFFEAAQMLGDLALGLGNYDGAAKYYGALAKAPWPDYQMRGAVLEARALVQKGDFAEALAKFEQVISSPVDTPEATRQKLMAQVGKAACLAGTGKPDEGIALLNDVIQKNNSEENSELFGRAYNALGACYLAAGKQQEALMAYLHTDVLFFAELEVHAEALYHLSKLWAVVKKQDRAVDAKSLLTDRYAGSTWAKRE